MQYDDDDNGFYIEYQQYLPNIYAEDPDQIKHFQKILKSLSAPTQEMLESVLVHEIPVFLPKNTPFDHGTRGLFTKELPIYDIKNALLQPGGLACELKKCSITLHLGKGTPASCRELLVHEFAHAYMFAGNAHHYVQLSQKGHALPAVSFAQLADPTFFPRFTETGILMDETRFETTYFAERKAFFTDRQHNKPSHQQSSHAEPLYVEHARDIIHPARILFNAANHFGPPIANALHIFTEGQLTLPASSWDGLMDIWLSNTPTDYQAFMLAELEKLCPHVDPHLLRKTVQEAASIMRADIYAYTKGYAAGYPELPYLLETQNLIAAIENTKNTIRLPAAAERQHTKHTDTELNAFIPKKLLNNPVPRINDIPLHDQNEFIYFRTMPTEMIQFLAPDQQQLLLSGLQKGLKIYDIQSSNPQINYNGDLRDDLFSRSFGKTNRLSSQIFRNEIETKNALEGVQITVSSQISEPMHYLGTFTHETDHFEKYAQNHQQTGVGDPDPFFAFHYIDQNGQELTPFELERAYFQDFKKINVISTRGGCLFGSAIQCLHMCARSVLESYDDTLTDLPLEETSLKAFNKLFREGSVETYGDFWRNLLQQKAPHLSASIVDTVAYEVAARLSSEILAYYRQSEFEVHGEIQIVAPRTVDYIHRLQKATKIPRSTLRDAPEWALPTRFYCAKHTDSSRHFWTVRNGIIADSPALFNVLEKAIKNMPLVLRSLIRSDLKHGQLFIRVIDTSDSPHGGNWKALASPVLRTLQNTQRVAYQQLLAHIAQEVDLTPAAEITLYVHDDTPAELIQSTALANTLHESGHHDTHRWEEILRETYPLQTQQTEQLIQKSHTPIVEGDPLRYTRLLRDRNDLLTSGNFTETFFYEVGSFLSDRATDTSFDFLQHTPPTMPEYLLIHSPIKRFYDIIEAPLISHAPQTRETIKTDFFQGLHDILRTERHLKVTDKITRMIKSTHPAYPNHQALVEYAASHLRAEIAAQFTVCNHLYPSCKPLPVTESLLRSIKSLENPVVALDTPFRFSSFLSEFEAISKPAPFKPQGLNHDRIPPQLLNQLPKQINIPTVPNRPQFRQKIDYRKLLSLKIWREVLKDPAIRAYLSYCRRTLAPCVQGALVSRHLQHNMNHHGVADGTVRTAAEVAFYSALHAASGFSGTIIFEMLRYSVKPLPPINWMAFTDRKLIKALQERALQRKALSKIYLKMGGRYPLLRPVINAWLTELYDDATFLRNFQRHHSAATLVYREIIQEGGDRFHNVVKAEVASALSAISELPKDKRYKAWRDALSTNPYLDREIQGGTVVSALYEHLGIAKFIVWMQQPRNIRPYSRPTPAAKTPPDDNAYNPIAVSQMISDYCNQMELHGTSKSFTEECEEKAQARKEAKAKEKGDKGLHIGPVHHIQVTGMPGGFHIQGSVGKGSHIGTTIQDSSGLTFSITFSLDKLGMQALRRAAPWLIAVSAALYITGSNIKHFEKKAQRALEEAFQRSRATESQINKKLASIQKQLNKKDLSLSDSRRIAQKTEALLERLKKAASEEKDHLNQAKKYKRDQAKQYHRAALKKHRQLIAEVNTSLDTQYQNIGHREMLKRYTAETKDVLQAAQSQAPIHVATSIEQGRIAAVKTLAMQCAAKLTEQGLWKTAIQVISAIHGHDSLAPKGIKHFRFCPKAFEKYHETKGDYEQCMQSLQKTATEAIAQKANPLEILQSMLAKSQDFVALADRERKFHASKVKGTKHSHKCSWTAAWEDATQYMDHCEALVNYYASPNIVNLSTGIIAIKQLEDASSSGLTARLNLFRQVAQNRKEIVSETHLSDDEADTLFWQQVSYNSLLMRFYEDFNHYTERGRLGQATILAQEIYDITGSPEDQAHYDDLAHEHFSQLVSPFMRMLISHFEGYVDRWDQDATQTKLVKAALRLLDTVQCVMPHCSATSLLQYGIAMSTGLVSSEEAATRAQQAFARNWEQSTKDAWQKLTSPIKYGGLGVWTHLIALIAQIPVEQAFTYQFLQRPIHLIGNVLGYSATELQHHATHYRNTVAKHAVQLAHYTTCLSAAKDLVLRGFVNGLPHAQTGTWLITLLGAYQERIHRLALENGKSTGQMPENLSDTMAAAKWRHIRNYVARPASLALLGPTGFLIGSISASIGTIYNIFNFTGYEPEYIQQTFANCLENLKHFMSERAQARRLLSAQTLAAEGLTLLAGYADASDMDIIVYDIKQKPYHSTSTRPIYLKIPNRFEDDDSMLLAVNRVSFLQSAHAGSMAHDMVVAIPFLGEVHRAIVPITDKETIDALSKLTACETHQLNTPTSLIRYYGTLKDDVLKLKQYAMKTALHFYERLLLRAQKRTLGNLISLLSSSTLQWRSNIDREILAIHMAGLLDWAIAKQDFEQIKAICAEVPVTMGENTHLLYGAYEQLSAQYAWRAVLAALDILLEKEHISIDLYPSHFDRLVSALKSTDETWRTEHEETLESTLSGSLNYFCSRALNIAKASVLSGNLPLGRQNLTIALWRNNQNLIRQPWHPQAEAVGLATHIANAAGILPESLNLPTQVSPEQT